MALLTTSYSRGPFFGGTGNRTGSAGSSAGCDGPVCHAANGGPASLNIALLRNGVPVSRYIPGQSYRIRLTLPVASATRRRNFGFQASAVKAADGVTQAGNITDGGRADITVHQDALVQLVEHNTYLRGALLNDGNFLDTVSFGWQSPLAGFGSVRIYAIINAVDSNRGPGGDQPRPGFQDFAEDTNGVGTGTASGTVTPSIYPNPVSSGVIQLRGLNASQAINLAVVDMKGSVIARRSGFAGTDGSFTMTESTLAPGQYVLVIAQGRMRSLPFQVK